MSKAIEIIIFISILYVILLGLKEVYGFQVVENGDIISEYFNKSYDREWMINKLKEDVIKDVLTNHSYPKEGIAVIGAQNLNKFGSIMEYCGYHISYGNMDLAENCLNIISRFNSHMEQLFLSSKTDILKVRLLE